MIFNMYDINDPVVIAWAKTKYTSTQYFKGYLLINWRRTGKLQW